MKRFLLGLGIVLLCGNAANAKNVSWSCKAPRTKSQITIFADKMIKITKDAKVVNYTCYKGFCVNFTDEPEFQMTTHETYELFYHTEPDDAGIYEPRAFRHRYYALVRGDVEPTLLVLHEEDIHTLRCERL